MAKIIIARKSEWNNKLREIGLYIDGAKVGTIRDGQTKEFEVEGGEHEVYAKIDWCGSQKVHIKTAEADRHTLSLGGFKYGSHMIPIILGLSVLYFLLVYYFKLPFLQVFWLPILIFLYPTYYLTLGRNQYLTLSKTDL
jgi:hypothetical protein